MSVYMLQYRSTGTVGLCPSEICNSSTHSSCSANLFLGSFVLKQAIVPVAQIILISTN